MERRPIATRDHRWTQRCAAALAHQGISPNAISVASSLFAALACLALHEYARQAAAPLAVRATYLISAAVAIQLRLLANLFDGMVAIEFDRKSRIGDVYNDLPDRISDSLVFVGLSFVL